MLVAILEDAKIPNNSLWVPIHTEFTAGLVKMYAHNVYTVHMYVNKWNGEEEKQLFTTSRCIFAHGLMLHLPGLEVWISDQICVHMRVHVCSFSPVRREEATGVNGWWRQRSRSGADEAMLGPGLDRLGGGERSARKEWATVVGV